MNTPTIPNDARTVLKIRAARIWLNLVLVSLLTLSFAAIGGDGLFWEIESKTGSRSYLFGTMHSEDPAAIALAAKTHSKLDRCDAFAMEIVPQFEMMQSLMLAMKIAADEPNLSEQIGMERFEKVAEALAKFSIPRAQLLEMQPWAVYATLSFPEPKTGEFVDLSLLNRAYAKGLTTHSLETVDEQLGFFLDMELRLQIELIDSVLDMLADMDKMFDALLSGYLADDLSLLTRISDKQLLDLPMEIQEQFNNRLIDQRNATMFGRMLPMVDSGCVFIAVGALHLPGERGLLARFRNHEYKLTPLALN